MTPEFVHSAKSDIGLKRAQNEDRFCADPDLKLFMVCDGMGGGKAGEVASTLAVHTIHRYLAETDSFNNAHDEPHDPSYSEATNRLAAAIRHANRVIHRESWTRADYAGMGTTVVAARLQDQIVSVAHVGDSRLYVIRGDTIRAVTQDHSWVAEQVLEGLLTEEEAKRSPHRHVVTRALGVQGTVEVDLDEVPLLAGDALLLCTDGLTRRVSPEDIVRTWRAASSVEDMSRRLIALANQAGGEDNTTVIVVACGQAVEVGRWERWRSRITGSRH